MIVFLLTMICMNDKMGKNERNADEFKSKKLNFKDDDETFEGNLLMN